MLKVTGADADIDCLPTNNSIPHYVSDNADDESVSTLGSNCEQHSSDVNDLNRSIFRDFWKSDVSSDDKKAISSSRHSSSTPSIRTESSFHHEEVARLDRYTHEMTILPEWSSYLQDCNEEERFAARKTFGSGYEEFLKINEAGRTARPSAALLNDGTSRQSFRRYTPQNPLCSVPSSKTTTTRRTIFSHKYTNQPTLPSYGYKYNSSSKRAGKSPLPFLLRNRKMLRSSLRDRSTSLSETTTADLSHLSSLSRLSVSFDPRVSIHEFNKPFELYVADGWSKNFA